MIKRIAIALIIAHFLTAAYALLYLLPGNVATIKANYFIDNSAVPDGMENAWYFKFLAEHILYSVTYACFCMIAFKYSRKLFLIICIFNLYHLIDFTMFLYNFYQSWWLYIALGALVIAGVVVVFLPIKEGARVVNME